MSLYRCAVCGSSMVNKVSKNEGYSIAKGVVGTALFGTGGAVMGVNGKSKEYYHCSACGNELSTTMSFSQQQSIDNYLSNPVLYADMLKYMKKQYPNIEWESNNNVGNESENKNTDTEKKFNNNEELADAMWNYYITSKIPYMRIDDLIKKVMGDKWYMNFNVDSYVAIDILAEKGLVTREGFDQCRFYDNAADIKKNIDNYNAQKKADNLFREKKDLFISELRNVLSDKNNMFYDDVVTLLISNLEKDYNMKNKEITKKLAERIILEAKSNYYVNVILDKETDSKILVYATDEEIKQKQLEAKKKKQLEEQERKKELEKRENQRKLEEKRQKLNELKTNNLYVNEVKKLLQDDKVMTVNDMKKNSELLDKIERRKLNNILILLCEFKELEFVINDEKVYYAMKGAFQRIEEEKQKLELEKIEYQQKLQKKLKNLTKKLKEYKAVYEENKNKIFGSGAKLKWEALDKIEELRNEIQDVREKLKDNTN